MCKERRDRNRDVPMFDCHDAISTSVLHRDLLKVSSSIITVTLSLVTKLSLYHCKQVFSKVYINYGFLAKLSRLQLPANANVASNSIVGSSSPHLFSFIRLNGSHFSRHFPLPVAYAELPLLPLTFNSPAFCRSIPVFPWETNWEKCSNLLPKQCVPYDVSEPWW